MGQTASIVVSVASTLIPAIIGLATSFSEPENIAPNPVLSLLERPEETNQGGNRAKRERQRLEQERVTERHRAEEKARLASEARRQAEESARRAAEERQKAERAQKEAEEKQRFSDEARAKAEKEKQAAEEASWRAEEARQKAEDEQRNQEFLRQEAERASTAAAQEAADARAAQEEAEMKLRHGIRPVIWPTESEIRDTKKRLNYRPGMLHFAVAGISGSGKSSLINALRGIPNKHCDAARVGVTETTMTVTSYADSDPRKPFLWYDIPGAGTLSIPDWQYFNDQGLYIFDSIIVLFDNRFTATDVALLRNAELFNIPTYILRSKSKQHIENLMFDIGLDDDEDEVSQYARARELDIASTRESVANNLLQAGLSQRRVYLVDAKAALYAVVRGKRTDAIIDELDFMMALLQEAHDRRVRPASSRESSAHYV